MTMTALLVAGLVAAITALDNVHLLQWMFSRPIVIGPAVGWCVGDLAAGMLCGAWIELAWLGVLPIGNYTPPDAHLTAACATVMSVAWGGSAAASPAWVGVSVLAVLIAVPAGILSKKFDLQLRRSLAEKAAALMEAPPPYALGPLVAASLVPVAGKAFLAVVMAGVIAIGLAPIVGLAVSEDRVVRGLAFAGSLMPALGMVQLARCIGARGREKWVALGAVTTLAALLALRFLP